MANQRKTPKENLDRLQEKARNFQKKLAPQVIEAISAEEAKRLIEELHLYQIELEMQNEQLQVVSEELSQAVIKYEDLYDFAPVGYVTLDEHSLILESNLTSSCLLGVDRRALQSIRFTRFIVSEHFNLFTSFLKNLRESETKQTCELTFMRPDNTILDARLEGIAFMPKMPEFWSSA